MNSEDLVKMIEKLNEQNTAQAMLNGRLLGQIDINHLSADKLAENLERLTITVNMLERQTQLLEGRVNRHAMLIERLSN